MENNRIQEFSETVIQINRISKKTKGGNQIRFSALVVVGDRKGKVGVGLGKAPNVVSGIRKAISQAKKNLIVVPFKGTTIPYQISVKYGAAKLLLKPAPAGSGIVAGGPLRAVFESAGVKDVIAKILGSNSKTANLYRAGLEAFELKISYFFGPRIGGESCFLIFVLFVLAPQYVHPYRFRSHDLLFFFHEILSLEDYLVRSFCVLLISFYEFLFFT